ncbi:MAG: hypothetical protein IAE77_16050 [Prosthecobacter sp.]|jgi:hypothetical protein|uniref:hypothetical protein n=1 Tax=Prosthecobacter sp. TaxID=1965333 RepID=UPI0019E10771|nr:hypothetical protein [Prosthecobacter sp.]MBE2284974.1 hypothetical protein [Prosthecobacter sp.]
MKTRILIPTCMLLGLSGLSAREFTDTQGRKLDAEILSATGDTVTLMRSGETRAIAAKIALFSEADQKFIREWAAANAKYSFDVSYTKKKLGEVKTRRNNTTYEQETWIYKISLKNREPLTVGDLRVDYWCFRKEDGGKGKGTARVETSGSIKVPTIAGSGTVTVDTSEIILNKQKLDGGFYYIDGSNSQQSDAVGGIAVRIFDKNGREVHKWATKEDLLAAAVGTPKAAGSNAGSPK